MQPHWGLQQRNLGGHHSAQSVVPAPVSQCPCGAPHPALGVAQPPSTHQQGSRVGAHPSREQTHQGQLAAQGLEQEGADTHGSTAPGICTGSTRRGTQAARRGSPMLPGRASPPGALLKEAAGSRLHPARVGEALSPEPPTPAGSLSTQLRLLPPGAALGPQPAPSQLPKTGACGPSAQRAESRPLGTFASSLWGRRAPPSEPPSPPPRDKQGR